MGAIEKINARLVEEESFGNMAVPDVRISRREFEAALAEAWEQGKRAEARMWAETADLATPDEDREQGRNPYKESQP